MPIVIKEIHVKTTVHKKQSDNNIHRDQLTLLKKELLKDIRDYLHREYLRKNES